MRAVQYTVLALAGARNTVLRSEVSASCCMPRVDLIASHMATSAAAISAGPLTMPPGRSSDGLLGIATVHSPFATLTTRNFHGLRNRSLSSRRWSSALEAAGLAGMRRFCMCKC